MVEYNNELIEFPKDWNVRKLKDIIIYRKGIKPKRFYIKKENDDYLPYLTTEYLRGESEPKYVNPNENKIIVAEPEDILMIWDGSGAGDLFIGFKGIVASTFVCIKCNKNIIYPKYLYYYLLKKTETLKQRTKGTGIPHINKETFENLLIPIPSLEEQKKIVKILNTVDSIITDTTNLIEKLKLLKEKTLNLLITGKMWHKEFKDTEIGRIPEEWKIVKLEEVTTKIADIDHKMPKKQKNGIPFVSIKCMLKYPDLNFYLDLNDPDLEFISKEDYEYYARRFNVEKGDIIYSRFGSIGHAKLVTTEQPFIASYSIVLIKPDTHKVNSAFLTYILNSEVVIKQVKIATKGSTNKNLHLRDIKNLKIPLPPLEEQKKIAEILSTIDKRIESETKYLDYMKKLKEKLLVALMTGKIRVNSTTIDNLK